uniref:Uncharacterized protein n=1 Tax=Amphimedon queenslandica TaxID=400682 RepID=A0A1X7U231_AMPQE
MSWTQLHPNDESMMKKANGGMVSLEFDGTDYLFMVGGMGPTPAVKHPQFQYVYDQMGRVITNEQLLYKLSNGQFTVPSVSGHCCPPNGAFTIDKINQNKGIMVGGASASNVYMFTVTRNTIHWENVTISGEGLWNERLYHASAIINVDSTSPALVVIGGASGIIELTKECLLFDNITTGQFSCKKIPLPNSVTDRYNHSLTAVAMSPNCVWLVIVGGTEGFMNHAPITDTNRLIMIAELVNIEAGEWTVQSVLDGNDLTSKKYQEKYLSYSKTRTWWMDQLIEYPTEKVMKLQRYIQSLHQELQVAHENKVSLQEALTEANKQGSKVDGSQLVIMNEKLEQVLKQKQILTEDNEKLRATVAYNEVYITEIEEEKKQVEEEKRKVEDENKQAKKEKKEAEEEKRQLEEQYLIDKQITKKLKAKVAVNDVYITELEEENEKVEKKYHKEKQITKELKAKVADNELCTAKLLKEKEEWDLTKVTNTKEVQFDYMIPSMDNLECLSDVQVAEKKLFLIQGDKPQLMNWEKYGLRIGVQEGSLLSSETVEAAVVALVGGQFEFPPNTVLVSAVYAVSLSKPLLKRLKLEIQHCIDLRGRPDLAQYLKFAIAPVSTPSLPYQFSLIEGGEFSSNGGYGFIERKDFCLVCILGLLIVSMTGGGGGGGQQQQGTGSQGAGVVPAQGGNAPVPQQQPVVNPQTQGEQSQEGQQPQGGDALTVLAQQQQPGVNEQTNGQQGEEGQEGQEQDAQLQSGDQSQSQNEQQEEGNLQKGGNQQGGKAERESKKQPEQLELQQQKGGREEDPVHVEIIDGKEDQIDENSIPVSTGSVTSPLASPVAAFESKNKIEVLDKPQADSKDVHSTGVKEATNYAGLVYYEKDDVGDLVTFTAAKKLNALLEIIKKEYPQAKRGPYTYFHIASPDGFVELNLNAPQDEPFTGWSIKPHIKPCRLYQDDINNFGDKDYPLPPSCPISVYGSPDAVPTLNYSVPLMGVVRPVTIYILASLRITNTASSNVGPGVPATVDVERVKRIINDVLVSHHAALNSLKSSLSDLADQLYTARLITDQVKETCSMDAFVAEFKASLNFKRKLPQVQEHCQKFLSSFIAVRGSYADAAIALGEDWIEAINELGFDYNINLDA